MTELLLLLVFLQKCEITGTNAYEGITLDISFLSRITNFIDLASADNYFAQVIKDLCRLDDAIVVGLSKSNGFVFDSEVFAKKRHSTLPRFLYGLLSTVFNDDGTLQKRFNTVSVQMLLEGLRLVRRAKSKAFVKMAADNAANKFIEYQGASRPGSDDTLVAMSNLWHYFETSSNFLESAVYGFPGSGVTNDMVFPYVPDLCFLTIDEQTTPSSTKRFLTKTADDLFGLAGYPIDDNGYRLPECQYVNWYKKPITCVAKLQIVDKKFDEGRAITTTFTANTIIGATLRNTIFNHHRINGTTSMVDVRNQQSSHKVLENHFGDVACIDLEGGSSCLTVENLDWMLSKTTFIGETWQYSRPDSFTYRGVEHELKTLTMGDASSVALLTTTLWLAMVLAFMQFHDISVNKYGYRSAVEQMLKDGRFRTIGDDLIFPKEYWNMVVDVLTGLGVTINERKSAQGDSHHKESCGAWFISNSLKHVRRIYPFRAASPLRKDFATVTQGIEQFVEKNENSPFSKCLFLAHTFIYLPLDFRIEYEQLLSHHASIAGTRYGTKWSHLYRSFQPNKQCLVDDSLAYIRNLSDSVVTPRFSRVPDVPRLRLRSKPVDLSSKSSKASYLASVYAYDLILTHYLSHKEVPWILRPRPLSPMRFVDVFSSMRWQNVAPHLRYIDRQYYNRTP